MVIVFSNAAKKELQKITDELVGIRIATERIATALEAQEPAREISSIQWHTDVPQEET